MASKKPICGRGHDTRVRGRTKDGHCRDCKLFWARRFQKGSHAKPGDWYKWNLKKYGLSITDYRQLLSDQGFRCAICGIHAEQAARRLAVDHDHKTGKVRGLLCGGCNGLLGLAKDSDATLEKARFYLKHNYASVMHPSI